MSRFARWLSLLFAALLTCGPALGAQQEATESPAQQDSAMALVKQARELSRQGKNAEALERYRQALRMSPTLFEARAGAGATLDLMGEYRQARAEFAKAIQDAPAKARPQALKMMAIS